MTRGRPASGRAPVRRPRPGRGPCPRTRSRTARAWTRRALPGRAREVRFRGSRAADATGAGRHPRSRPGRRARRPHSASTAPAARATAGPGSRPQSTSLGTDMEVLLSTSRGPRAPQAVRADTDIWSRDRILYPPDRRRRETGQAMDLRRQLHEVLWARVLFTLALLVAVLWVQLGDGTRRHSCCSARPSASWSSPTCRSSCSSRAPRRSGSPGCMVVVDLALVTAAVVFSGGALSPAAVFYVWPIILATVFLPVWAPYATAVAAGAAYAAIWALRAGRRATPARAWCPTPMPRRPGRSSPCACTWPPSCWSRCWPGASPTPWSRAPSSSPTPRPTPTRSCGA